MMMHGTRIEGATVPVVPGWAIFTEITVLVWAYLVRTNMTKLPFTEHAMLVTQVKFLRGHREQRANRSMNV